MAYRRDRGSLRSPKFLADGTVRVDAIISRAGVFEYLSDDGRSIVREYRPAEQVFSEASMKSFELVPVTYQHPSPSDNGGLVDESNRENHAVGVVLENVRRDGDFLIASLHVTDPVAISALKRGETAVSCGYDQDIIQKAGTAPDGTRFDAVQTNIVGNHVAMGVGVPRAGDSARVRMDSATMIAGEPAKEIVMEELKKALADLAVATVAASTEKSRADSATAELTTVKAALAKAEADRDAAKDAAEKANKARTDSESGSMDRARARIALEASAQRHLRTDAADTTPVDLSAYKTDTEIKAAIVSKLTGKPCARTDAAYVDARYDAAIEAEGPANEALAEIRGAALNPVRADGSPSSKAREEYLNRQQNSWNTTNNTKQGA